MTTNQKISASIAAPLCMVFPRLISFKRICLWPRKTFRNKRTLLLNPRFLPFKFLPSIFQIKLFVITFYWHMTEIFSITRRSMHILKTKMFLTSFLSIAKIWQACLRTLSMSGQTHQKDINNLKKTLVLVSKFKINFITHFFLEIL